jgi:enoyl-[acyl-carrier protein] reductase/trans-2-enoyl-CoA reductase (NAD+)
VTDENGLIRLDDWEMRDDVQQVIADLWPTVTSENLEAVTDLAGYESDFLKLFGFGLPGVDYEADVDHLVGLD